MLFCAPAPVVAAEEDVEPDETALLPEFILGELEPEKEACVISKVKSLYAVC
jgi:hypothetical protein